MKRTGLIEVLIIIVVIAIPAALIIQKVIGIRREAREENSLKANLAEIRAMVDVYKQQHDAYPASLERLTKEKNDNTGKPYMAELPIDPFTGTAEYDYAPATGIHSKAEGASWGCTAYKDF